VGALDEQLQVADFSNRALNKGGEVDLAAPGVAIYSSWPMPTGHRTVSGTSMATPFVAGIAAMLCEKQPAGTPSSIVSQLKEMAKRLSQLPEDVGAGLTLAPMRDE
jgi:subtilisin family serine protease